MSSEIVPFNIKLRKKSRLLQLFYDGYSYELSYEFLRVYSPSAEVRGHSPSQRTLQLNKVNVSINSVELVGTYAIRIVFDDGHDTGLYSWDYLKHLAECYDELWREYLLAIREAGHSRENWLGDKT